MIITMSLMMQLDKLAHDVIDCELAVDGIKFHFWPYIHTALVVLTRYKLCGKIPDNHWLIYSWYCNIKA